jgi:hypothetical protein
MRGERSTTARISFQPIKLVLKPFKQSAGFQEKHAVAPLHRNQMRLPSPVTGKIKYATGKKLCFGPWNFHDFHKPVLYNPYQWRC